MHGGVRERGDGDADPPPQVGAHGGPAPPPGPPGTKTAAVGFDICRAGERLASVSIANETNPSCFSLNQSDHRAEPKLIHSVENGKGDRLVTSPD